MTKVLITGGAGFIGYHLAQRLLSDNYEIDMIDNLSRGVVDRDLKALTAAPGIRLLNIDLLNPDSLKDLDNNYQFIYHFAAIIGVAHVLKRPFAVLQDNTLMLLNMLSLARRQKRLERLIFTSTSEVYAGTLQHFALPIPTPESTPLAITDLKHPRTSYMLSKIYGEALCQQSGTDFTIIRPHNIYGPRMGMAHVIPELLQRADSAPADGLLKVFSIDHQRTFCYVTDGVEMIKRAAETPACSGETLNVGNQSPEVNIGELAGLVLKVTGKNLKIDPQPASPGSPLRRCPETTKTTTLTGYESQVGLEKGIELTYNWYKNHIFSGDDITAK